MVKYTREQIEELKEECRNHKESAKEAVRKKTRDTDSIADFYSRLAGYYSDLLRRVEPYKDELRKEYQTLEKEFNEAKRAAGECAAQELEARLWYAGLRGPPRIR